MIIAWGGVKYIYIDFIRDNAMLKFTKRMMGAVLGFGLIASSLNAEIITHNGYDYGTVTSPHTGRVWLDRNLGATQSCTALDDSACYGDYYQWGRGKDGHEKVNSARKYTKAWGIHGAGNKFISIDRATYDWTSDDQTGVLRYRHWSRTDGSAICPKDFRVPSPSELKKETLDVEVDDYTDGFNSFLKLPVSSSRDNTGHLSAYNNTRLWTTGHSFPDTSRIYYGRVLELTSTSAHTATKLVGYGVPVRCIKIIPNMPPVVNTDSEQTVTFGETVFLDATASSDSDGSIVSYEWKEGERLLSTGSNYSSNAFSVGVHVITLVVTDDDGATARDEVVITVKALPNELIHSNGTFANSLDYIHKTRKYEFALSGKSRLAMKVTSDNMSVAGWIKDMNNTIMTNTNDKYLSSNIDIVLDAGTYYLELLSRDGSYGDFSFIFDTSGSLENKRYSLDFEDHVILHYSGVSKVLLNTHNLENNNFTVTSENLPTTWKIEKNYNNEWIVVINDLPSENIDVSFQVVNSEIEFDKTYVTHFSIAKYKVKALRGTGEGSELAIILDENNVTKPIRLSFDVNSESIADKIESVECYFGSEGHSDYIGFAATSATEVSEDTAYYECDASRASSFVGADNVENFMSKLVDMEYVYRYLSVKINQKDGASIFKSDYKSIPAEYATLSNFIELVDIPSLYGASRSVTTQVEIRKEGESAFATEHISKGGIVQFYENDTIVLHYGTWKFRVGSHWFTINMGEKDSNFVVRLSKNNLNDTDILSYNFINEVSPETVFELIGKRKESSAPSLFQKLNLIRKFLIEDNPKSFGDSTTAIRGTTFIVRGDSNDTRYEVLEGIVDINKSGIVTTLNSMEQFDLKEDNKTSITNMELSKHAKEFLEETSLFQTELDATISKLKVDTNRANSSYVLIGDNVRVGSGTLNLFDNISEGNYTLRFLPIDGSDTPADVNLTFNKDKLFEAIRAIYKLEQRPMVIDGLNGADATSEDGNVTLDRNGVHIELFRDLVEGRVSHFLDVNGIRSWVYINVANAEIKVDERGRVLTSFSAPKEMSVEVLEDGKVRPSIDGALLPKGDLPAGTKVEIDDEKIKFTVPMAENIEF